MPTFATRAMNAVPTLLLRSPLHGAMSGRYLLLTFTGRVSGRRITTPVAYVQSGNRLVLSTDSRWARNVIGGRPVTARLRGRSLAGKGHRITDPQERVSAMRALLDIPGYARAVGIERVEGTVPAQHVRDAADARTVIAIDLEDEA